MKYVIRILQYGGYEEYKLFETLEEANEYASGYTGFGIVTAYELNEIAI